jgi:hypothetical protein
MQGRLSLRCKPIPAHGTVGKHRAGDGINSALRHPVGESPICKEHQASETAAFGEVTAQ